MSEKLFHVYIMTNPSHTTFYTGVTSNLIQRITQHKEKLDQNSFTAKYNCCKLVYLEDGSSSNGAIAREKQVKDMRRERKIELIETINPSWRDLYEDIIL
jgi:putative endonuclease